MKYKMSSWWDASHFYDLSEIYNIKKEKFSNPQIEKWHTVIVTK